MRKYGFLVVALLLSWGLVACSSAPAAQTSFDASLSGGAEVPAVTTSGTGSATAVLSGNTITVTGTYSGLSGPATAAHIHGPAAKDATAGVVLALTAAEGTTAGSGTLSGTGTLTDAQITQLRDGLYYINVHTAANASGEIRGQLE
ncbi:MAG: CHRD domain-containing protein [Trueperaceae bacterium]|nr:CHRD domain-containing protein [Trueperaceae bacterium]